MKDSLSFFLSLTLQINLTGGKKKKAMEAKNSKFQISDRSSNTWAIISHLIQIVSRKLDEKQSSGAPA